MKKPPTSWMQPDPRQPLPAHARPGDRAKPATTATPNHPIDSGMPMKRICPSCSSIIPANAKRCAVCGDQSPPIYVEKAVDEVVRAADAAMFWASYQIGRMDRQHAAWLAKQNSPETKAADAARLAKIRQDVDAKYRELWARCGWNGIPSSDVLRKADGESMPQHIRLDDDRSDK
jgi:hypothetical protein